MSKFKFYAELMKKPVGKAILYAFLATAICYYIKLILDLK